MQLSDGQIEAVEFLKNARAKNKDKGLIIGDKVGLGKTAPAIEFAKQTPGKKLIVCPAYLIYNWRDEINFWGVPASDVCVADSRDQVLEDKKIYLVAYSRIAIETYKTPTGGEKKRPNGITRQLLKKKFGLVICDEAHYLKTWNSQRSRSGRRLSRVKLPGHLRIRESEEAWIFRGFFILDFPVFRVLFQNGF